MCFGPHNLIWNAWSVFWPSQFNNGMPGMPGPCFCHSQFNIECLECLERVFVFNMEHLSVWSVFWGAQFNMECLECLECVLVFNTERLECLEECWHDSVVRAWIGAETNLVSSEGDLHVGVDEVLAFAREGPLDVGHDAGVHLGQSLRPVHLHAEPRPRPVSRHPVWQ